MTYSHVYVSAASPCWRLAIARYGKYAISWMKIVVMSALDLASGYHQIPLLPEECERTAFYCGPRLMEYSVIPFGSTNAPAVFSKFTNIPLRTCVEQGVALVYLDDILIISKSLEQHLEHLRTVLSIFRENSLYCKPAKCKFNVHELP